MTFDLRLHIRAVLAETAEENLDTLASMVFDRTAVADVREAYRQALTEIVRRELATAPRPDHTAHDAQQTFVGSGLSSAGDDQGSLDTHLAGVVSGGNIRNSRAALFRRYRFRESVWVGEKTFRNILDCTAQDLAFAAAESERQAENNAAASRRYRRLAKAMAEHGAATVAELTDEQIRQAMGDE